MSFKFRTVKTKILNLPFSTSKETHVLDSVFLETFNCSKLLVDSRKAPFMICVGPGKYEFNEAGGWWIKVNAASRDNLDGLNLHFTPTPDSDLQYVQTLVSSGALGDPYTQGAYLYAGVASLLVLISANLSMSRPQITRLHNLLPILLFLSNHF